METEHTPEGRHHLRKRIWGLVVVLVLVSGWFYWSQVRPADIRSTCAIETGKRAFGANEQATTTKGLDLVHLQNELFETYYLLCVRSRGLPH